MNLLLIAIIAWGVIKMHFVKEQVLVTEIQANLIVLEGLIARQHEDHWSEPHMVTTALEDVLNGIFLSMNTGEQLGIMSKHEEEILIHLYSKLNQYPYGFVDLTEEDKKNFEKLREILRDVGLGINMSISANSDTFMNQAETLYKKIDAPLH